MLLGTLVQTRNYMNKLFFLVVLLAGPLLSAPVAAGQNKDESATSNQDLALLKKDVQSQRKQIVAANLQLTDAEAVKFWPIYDKYAADLSNISDTRLALVKEYADAYPN